MAIATVNVSDEPATGVQEAIVLVVVAVVVVVVVLVATIVLVVDVVVELVVDDVVVELARLVVVVVVVVVGRHDAGKSPTSVGTAAASMQSPSNVATQSTQATTSL